MADKDVTRAGAGLGEDAPDEQTSDLASGDALTREAELDTPSTPFWEEPPPPAPPARVGSGAGRSAIAWFLAALLGAGVGAGASYVALDGGRAGVSTVRVSPPREAGTLPAAEDAVAAVAEAVLPSIVQIGVEGSFGGSGLGSGVIYTPDGFIITNDHVVSGAREIIVNLSDGTSLPASVVGSARDIGIDIAVLRVVPDQPTLAAATFGSSRDVRVGELAVAIGSPFGLDSTVTSGIISAMHRNRRDVPVPDAIQTDAAINQGNSGGALANSRGEVIGVNTAIIGGVAGGNIGVGFAIPIDIVRKVADQIIDTGSAELAFLGVEGDSLPGARGARISGVLPGSAAAEAGLQEGDVIIRVAGEDIASMEALISLLLRKNVGEIVRVVALRDGRERTFTATLGARRR